MDPSKELDVHADKLILLKYFKEDLPIITNVARHDAKEEVVAEVLGHDYRIPTGGKRKRLFLHIKWIDGSESWEPDFHATNTDMALEYISKHIKNTPTTEEK